MDNWNCFWKKKFFSFQAAKKPPKHKPPTNQEQNPNTLAEKQTRRKPPKSKPVKFLFLYYFCFVSLLGDTLYTLHSPPLQFHGLDFVDTKKKLFSHMSSVAWNKLFRRGKTSFPISTFILCNALLTLSERESQHSPAQLQEFQKKTVNLIHML